MDNFLDGFTTPNLGIKKPKSSGDFLDDFNLPTESTYKGYVYNVEAERLKKEAEQLNSFGGLLKGTVGGLAETGESFVTNTWKTWEQTPHLLWEDIQSGAADIAKSFDQDKPFAERTKDAFKGIFKGGGRTAADIANAIFAPISVAIGTTLEASGGQKLVDKTGQVIADSTGITDMPRFQQFAMEHPNAAEDFNRIMTLAMSGMEKSPINITKLPGEIKTFTNNIIKPAKPVNVPVVSEGGVNTIPVNTPQSRYQKYLKEQGYEPYVAESKLPTIDMGKPAKDTLPTIQIGDSIKISRSMDGEYVYEPILARAPKATVETPTATPKGRTAEIKVEEAPLSEKTVSSQAKDIARTLENDFDIMVNADDLATFKTKENFMADQAQKALNLRETNPIEFNEIAMGNKNAKGGLTNETVFATAKKLAIENGDTQTLLDLSTSKVASRASKKGQDIKSLDVLDSGTFDPVKALVDIRSGREAAFERTTRKSASEIKNQTVTEVQKEIKSRAPTKKSWEDFIEQIKCSY